MSQETATWEDLAGELDAWATDGRPAKLWWRDDDAGALTPALARLLDLVASCDVPLAVAAIPDRLEPEALRHVGAHENAALLQHCYRHVNHEPASAKKAEFGTARTHAAALADLRAGRERLETLGARALPVLVPPWNRIAAGLRPLLPSAGITGLSTYLARPKPETGVCQVNTHVDIIDWRGTRGFVGTAEALGRAVAHLRARRLGDADPDEPTGLLSHHAVHDDAAWHFIDTFLRATKDHAAVEWPAIAALFGQATRPEESGASGPRRSEA